MKKLAVIFLCLLVAVPGAFATVANNSKLSPDLLSYKAPTARVVIQYNSAPGPLDLQLVTKLVSTVDSIVIKRVGSIYELDVTSDMGGDAVEHFTYPVPIHDSATTLDLPDGSQMHTTFAHRRDTTSFTTEITGQGQPIARQRGLMYPSADGRTLTRDVMITPLSGASRTPIHVKLVYEKRNSERPGP